MNIPVIFRNLRGYDNHFIMQEIGQIVKKKTIQLKNRWNSMLFQTIWKKYVAFMLSDHLVFLDSFQFVSSSLDKRVSNLPNEAFEIHITSREKEGSLSIWLYVQFW